MGQDIITSCKEREFTITFIDQFGREIHTVPNDHKFANLKYIIPFCAFYFEDHPQNQVCNGIRRWNSFMPLYEHEFKKA